MHERYAARLLALRATAREHGYALAVHGSEVRDLDLVAVPWIESASAPEVLVEVLRIAVSGYVEYGREGRDPVVKPHGRLAWSIHIGGGLYIDLSVMPLRVPE